MEKLTFVTEDQESVDFYIIEETRVNGINYLLVTESEDEEDEEAEAYILKDTSKAEDTELLITWLIPHQQISPETANRTERTQYLLIFPPLFSWRYLCI